MKEIIFPIFVNDFSAMFRFFERIELAEVQDLSAGGVIQADVRFRGGDLDFVIALLAPSNDAERAAVGRQAPEGKWLLSLPVDDIAEWRERMVQKGLEVPQVVVYPWGGEYTVIKDPSGNSYLIAEKRYGDSESD